MIYLKENGEFSSKLNINYNLHERSDEGYNSSDGTNAQYELFLDWVGDFDSIEEMSEYMETIDRYNRDYAMQIDILENELPNLDQMHIISNDFEALCEFLTNDTISYISNFTDSLYNYIFEFNLNRKPTSEEIEIMRKFDDRDLPKD